MSSNVDLYLLDVYFSSYGTKLIKYIVNDGLTRYFQDMDLYKSKFWVAIHNCKFRLFADQIHF
jgi:hypothetical protein